MSCSKTVACKRENIAGINVLQTLRKFGFGELQLEQMVDVCWKKILGLVLSSFKGSAGCDHLRVIMSAKIDWWMEQAPFVVIKIPSEKGFQVSWISPLNPLFLSLRQGVNKYQLLHLLRQVVGRGMCNVKRFSWLQLSIIQLFLDASKDICREKISTWIATELCLSSPWKDAQSKICSNECKKKRQQVAKKEKKHMPQLFVQATPSVAISQSVPVFAKEDKCNDDSWPRKMLKPTTTICHCQPFQSVSFRHSIWCIGTLPCGFQDNVVVTL